MTLRSCDLLVTIRNYEFMPKDTFLNLPEDKRRLIEDVALDEFAEFGFDNASINRIVTAAGIAKGSFYQYFGDKGDLYKHILAIIAQKKGAYITPAMQNPEELDFFAFLEQIYRSGLAFAKDQPKAAKIGFEVYKNQTNPVFEEIYQQSRRMGFAFYEPLINQGIVRDEIDPDIDKPFTIHMLMHLQVASFDYVLETIKGDVMNPANWPDDFMPTIHLMINFIKNGIQRRKQGALKK